MADEDSKNLTCEIQDGAPVIPIGGYNAAQPARLVAELRSYWDGLRQGRAVPMRTDVQPAGIGAGILGPERAPSGRWHPRALGKGGRLPPHGGGAP